MKLIVNKGVRFLSKEKSFEGYIYQLLYQLCRLKDSDTFIFLTYDNIIPLPPNGIGMNIKVPFLAKPMHTIWYNRKLTALIKEEKAELLISLDGRPVPSDIPQMLIIADDLDIKKIRLIALRIKKDKRCHLVVSSNTLKQKLIGLGIPGTVIGVLPQVPDVCFEPAEWEKKEGVRNKYTGGKEFFFMPIANVSSQHLINTLKAFSQFKKWQKSNMLLVIWGNSVMTKQTKLLLETYRYRNDVLIMDDNSDINEYVGILASAMAMIYMPAYKISSIWVAEAMQSGIPVIATPSALLSEISRDTVLVCDSGNIDKLAGEMVKLYKDEKFRYNLSRKGREVMLPYKEAFETEKLWNYIRQMVSQ